MEQTHKKTAVWEIECYTGIHFALVPCEHIEPIYGRYAILESARVTYPD